jgi:hypothetical protein
MKKKDLTIYVSGPMTGYKNYNYDKFKYISEKLREKGYKVIDPASDVKPMMLGGKETTIERLHQLIDAGEVSEQEAWITFLRGDLVEVAKNCNAIYLLNNWCNSRGARAERSLAKTLKFNFFKEGDLFTPTEYKEIKKHLWRLSRKK